MGLMNHSQADLAAPSPRSPDERLQDMREAFVEVAWTGLAWLCVVLLALSIWRIANFSSMSQWPARFFWPLMAIVGFVLAFFFRNRMPYRAKAGLLVFVFLFGGASAFPTFGFAGGGATAWIVTGCFICGVIFQKRATTVAIAFSALTVGLAGYGFISGAVVSPVDLNIMVTQPAAWAHVMLSVVATTGILVTALSIYSRSVRELLKDVERQRILIERLATHDSLTGLPMLRTAGDRCEVAIHQARRTGAQLALMFIDLDGFKLINDTYGHAAGDHVLKEVATRLKATVREADTAARIGGDEFLVLLTALDSAKFAGDIADKLIRAVGAPIHYNGQTLTVGVSIGISLYPDHGEDASVLRRAADEAMYSVKKLGGNQYAWASEPSYFGELSSDSDDPLNAAAKPGAPTA